MSRRKIIIFIVFSFMFFPCLINAACNNQEIVGLKNTAANVNFSTDYIEVDNQALFRIKITNLQSDIYMMENYNYSYVMYGEDENPTEHVTEYVYPAGTIIRFEFFSDNEKCYDIPLYTKHVNLPSYNYLYNDPLCKGIEEFKLCQKWIKLNLNYEEFKDQIEKYKYVEENPIDDGEKEKKENIWFLVIDFLSKYYIFIFGSIVIIGITSIYMINRKNSFNL